MLKFIVGIAIVAFSSFCGYMLAGKYRKKKEFFVQFALFNERFIAELSYYKRPIKEFSSQYNYKGEFEILLQEFLNTLSSHDYLFNEWTLSSQFFFLNEDEKRILSEYFITLGRSDTQSQKNYFFTAKDRLNSMRDEAEKTCTRYADLYVKLGFLCGLFILILIL